MPASSSVGHDREQLLHDRPLDEGGHEPGVDDVHAVVDAGHEVVGDEPRDGQDVGERRALAEALEVGGDRHAGAAHGVAALAADGQDPQVARVLRDLAGREAHGVGVEGAREAAVRGHDDDQPVVLRVQVAAGQQRVVRLVQDRGEVRDDLVELLAVGTRGQRGLLGPAQLGGRDELHRPGDLLDVLRRARCCGISAAGHRPNAALRLRAAHARRRAQPPSAYARNDWRKASIASSSAAEISSVSARRRRGP